MIFQIVKRYTTEKCYKVEADSIEDAVEYVDCNPNLYDDEEVEEKTFVDGKEWQEYW